jgi:molybdenum-dependent DNA-binding transcriptional regulator ModE
MNSIWNLERIFPRHVVVRMRRRESLAGMLGERLLESYARYEKLFKGQTMMVS